MSYLVKDQSTHDGEPVECYKVITPLGEFLYTSDPEPVMLGGEEYAPLNISHTPIETNTLIDGVQTVDFVLPIGTALSQLVAFRKTPESLTIELRSAHRGDDFATDFALEYTGTGTASKVSGEWVTLETQSVLQAQLSGDILTVTYQRVCNHVLYDERCKAIKADFTLIAAITRVQNQLITVDNDGAPNDDFNGGEMVNVRTGERRGIINNTDNLVRVGFEFLDAQVGDDVQLIYGCNHLRLGHCKTRFDNVVNYGGFDFIPTVNPFTDMNRDNLATVVETIKQKITVNPITMNGGSQ